MKELINRKEVLEFLEEDFGFWEYIRMIAPRIGIDETEAIELADEVRLTIRDTIESMPATKEREVKVNIYRDFTGDYLRTHYTCMKCQKTAISENEEKMFFCPFCGEKFEEVKYGKWVRHKPNGILWTLKCSECGWIDNRTILCDEFNYCPSCGVKMG